MQFIDKHTDPWRTAGGEDGPISHPPVAAHSLLTLEQWHAVRLQWPERTATGYKPVGVIVPNSVDIETLEADLGRIALLALQFPKWVDGRAYTQARLLRARMRYDGEVRATGEVLVDMVPLLARTGFSSAVLRADQSRDAAERALGFFATPGHYQGDVLHGRAVFGRAVA